MIQGSALLLSVVRVNCALSNELPFPSRRMRAKRWWQPSVIRRVLLLSVSMLIGDALVWAQKPINYSFAPFAATFPGTDHTNPLGISDRGQIVGTYHVALGGRFGFLYDRGVFTSIDVPFLGQHETVATDINNRGQIVGYFEENCCNRFHAFLLERGMFTLFDAPFPGVTQTLLVGINDRGQIVGTYFDGQGSHGFILDRGVFTSLDVPFPGAHDTTANGINNRGEIVGIYLDSNNFTQGFIFDRGTFTGLTFPPPRTITNGAQVNGINDRGDIVGCHELHAFIIVQGVFAFLDDPFVSSCAGSVNNRGVIVGAEGSGLQGFIAAPVPPQ
jgi:uncharacterized membrane protein